MLLRKCLLPEVVRETRISSGQYFCIAYNCGKRRLVARVVGIQSRGNHTFFRDNQVSICIHCYVTMLKLFRISCCLIASEKCVVTPNFLSDSSSPC